MPSFESRKFIVDGAVISDGFRIVTIWQEYVLLYRDVTKVFSHKLQHNLFTGDLQLKPR